MGAFGALTDGASGVTSKAIESASQKAQGAANLNFDTFIKLLTTQLQNQDPLKPMDGTAFTEQIATFSALEQQIATNSNLEKLVASDTFGAQTLAVSYIGKEALVPGAKTSLSNGKLDFTYSLDKRALSNEIKIVDSKGSIVKTIDGDLSKGSYEITWDGKSDTGEQLDDGEYTIFIEAAGADGNAIQADIFSFSEIYAVEAEGENINLITKDGTNVDFKSVRQVRANQSTAKAI